MALLVVKMWFAHGFDVRHHSIRLVFSVGVVIFDIIITC